MSDVLPPEEIVSASGLVEANGTRLYYEATGEGQPLVLIHAGIADSGMWDPQVPDFAEHFRVIRYDVRGFGKSVMSASPFSHVDDLHALLRRLRVGRTHLLGVSLGGGIAMELAITHPDLVSGLVLVAPGLGGYTWSDALTRRMPEIGALYEAGNVAEAVELTLRIWVDGPGRQPHEVDRAVRERVRDMETNNATTLTVENQARPMQPPAIERLGEIRAPTLVVVGDGDVPDMLAIADLLAQRIPNARKVSLPRVAHMLTMETPSEFNKIALEFLRNLPN